VKRFAVVVALAIAACGGADRVIVGAGTTLVDSGFIDTVVARYEAATGGEVSVIAESSQRLLDLARRGEVDVLFTHEPAALEVFIAEGNAARSMPIFVSSFLIAGPPDLAARLEATTFAAALSEIARNGYPFVSRADGSGTYRNELLAWQDAGVDPSGATWYDTTGQGMGLTLQVASERGAFVFVEEGSWLQSQVALDLVALPLTDTRPNPYFVTLASGSGGAAATLFAWVTGPDGAAAIEAANDELYGRRVYRLFRP
jgi:tungstate transport system substrate-binding protein